MPHPEEILHEQREWLRVTLSSIGDAVITTDTHGAVTFLNPVAQSLTGWNLEESLGLPLDTVFRIVNEDTRQTVENPATRALREGLVVGLANHTLLIARDGTERPIDDSAAPIRDRDGQIAGVVLVFRDVTQRRKQEMELKESEERFRLLVDRVKDYAIFMLDPKGIITTWNAGAQHLKGYRAEEIIGRHFSCFYPAEAVAARFPDQELEVATAEGRFEDEGWRIRKDGSRFWANVVITALRDDAGNLCGFAKVTRDLTERKAADEALRLREERFRTLTETASDAIITADANNRIISWNQAAVAMFGYREEEVLGQPLPIIMPERYRAAHLKGFERLQATGQSRLIGKTIELEGRRKDGSEFPLELSLTAWQTEEGKFYTGIIRDVTERKKREQAERESQVLADLNRRKDEFLAMLSHELRNPLAPISTAVELLRRNNGDETMRETAMTILGRQVAHLTRMVDDLLEVSRISTGRIRLQQEQIDMRRVVERAVETVRPLILARKHELIVSLDVEPISVDADPTRLEQIVVNLLTNAAKYTNTGGQIRLTLQREGDEAVLRIADSGVGIAPELLPSIFDLFTQAERSLDRSQGGLGVGLTIVQRVVELHGGNVTAYSAGLGHGSEFVVRLPVAQVSLNNSSAPASRTAERLQQNLRLLVVDDNKDAADSIAMLLRRKGHDVRVAYSSESAIELAGEYRPDAVLLDIGLPQMDGYEVARRLRQNRNSSSVRLIALTGYGREEDQQRAQEAGFDAHLVKPVELQKIDEILANLAGRRESEI